MAGGLIPDSLVPALLRAAAVRDRSVLLHLSLDLGVSVPLLWAEALRLARDPRVYAEYPRACRVILERVERRRARR